MLCLCSSVFWGGREGFHSLHNTDVAAELKHMANFFKMAVSKCILEYGDESELSLDVSHLESLYF